MKTGAWLPTDAHSLGLALSNPLRLMPALVALKDANLRTVVVDRIGSASSQMRIAAAFDTAERSNKFLFLDDEGTLLHSPAPDPRRSGLMQSDKGRGIWTKPKFLVKRCAKRPTGMEGNRAGTPMGRPEAK
jgi:hypothetical protein